jgi:aryl-alcohol dehydrogenase-like predicted oxidoreductase
VLGKALREIPRDSYYLATKVGRYGSDEFDFSADRVTASVDESLARLGVEHVDVIQCHDIEFGDLNQIVDETLPALDRVREQGKARFIGITGLPLSVFTKIGERAEIDMVLSYCHYCLNDTALTGILPFLKGRGIGIINASPLSMGLLTNRGVPDWHPADLDIRLSCSRAAAHCRSRGVDIAKLAIQFAVANVDIATTLVGTANPEHLRNNVAWIEEPLNAELLADTQAILDPIHNKTWPSGRDFRF